MSKGSKRRPSAVTAEEFDKKWGEIFKGKKKLVTSEGRVSIDWNAYREAELCSGQQNPLDFKIDNK